MNIKKLKKLLPIIGILIFLYIVINIDIEKIISALSVIKPQYIFLIFFLWIPNTLADVYSWRVTLKKHKINVGFLYLFKLSLIGTYYATVTPGGFGWYAMAFHLKDETGEPIEKCTTDIILFGTLHIIALFMFALVGVCVLAGKIGHFFPLIIILFSILCILCIIFLHQKTGKKIIRFFIKLFIPTKFKDGTDTSVDLLYKDFPSIKDLLYIIFIVFLTWIVFFLTVYLVARLLLIDVPFIDFILIYSIGVILTLIPISIGGFGIREASLIALFSTMFFISPEKIVALCLIESIFISWFIPSAIGAFLSTLQKKRRHKTTC